MTTCSGAPDGSCDCGGVCGVGDVKVTCFTTPGGGATCLCNLNGKDVGKCESSGSGFPCDFGSGCCAAYF